MTKLIIPNPDTPMNRLPALALVFLLAGCGTGFPWGRGKDPQAGAAVTETAPLVATCEAAFKTWLAGRPATVEGGPSIARVDSTVTVELEAMSTGPMAIDPWRYSCSFVDGEMTGSGLVK
jgi:hypothetical protein